MVLGVNRGAAGCAQAMHAALSATPPPPEGDGERAGSALIAADAGGKPGSGNEWAGERRDREDSAIYSGDRPDGVLVPAQAAAPEAADEAGVQVRTDAPFSGPPPRPSLECFRDPPMHGRLHAPGARQRRRLARRALSARCARNSGADSSQPGHDVGARGAQAALHPALENEFALELQGERPASLLNPFRRFLTAGWETPRPGDDVRAGAGAGVASLPAAAGGAPRMSAAAPAPAAPAAAPGAPGAPPAPPAPTAPALPDGGRAAEAGAPPAPASPAPAERAPPAAVRGSPRAAQAAEAGASPRSPASPGSSPAALENGGAHAHAAPRMAAVLRMVKRVVASGEPRPDARADLADGARRGGVAGDAAIARNSLPAGFRLAPRSGGGLRALERLSGLPGIGERAPAAVELVAPAAGDARAGGGGGGGGDGDWAAGGPASPTPRVPHSPFQGALDAGQDVGDALARASAPPRDTPLWPEGASASEQPAAARAAKAAAPARAPGDAAANGGAPAAAAALGAPLARAQAT